MREQQKWAEDNYCKNEIIQHRIKSVITKKQTAFQKVDIYDLYDFGISLFIDDIPQSSMKDEAIYHECLVQPAILFNKNRENFQALVLGTGEGATLRELLKHDFITNIDAVDIDREAVKIFRQHLKPMHRNSYDHNKVNLLFDNAGDFLLGTVKPYDVIISDITDVNFFNLGAAEARKQIDFYSLIKSKLKKDGILAMHSSELTEIHYNKHLALRELLQTVFARVFSYRVYVPFFECPWGFLIATDDTKIYPTETTEEEFSRLLDNKTHWKFINPRNLRSIFSVQEFYKIQ